MRTREDRRALFTRCALRSHHATRTDTPVNRAFELSFVCLHLRLPERLRAAFLSSHAQDLSAPGAALAYATACLAGDYCRFVGVRFVCAPNVAFGTRLSHGLHARTGDLELTR